MNVTYDIEVGTRERAQKVVITGPEGVGKTTLAAQFPDPIFIDAEAGSTHLPVARFQLPQTWADVIGMVRQGAQDSRFRTIVVDTVDSVEKLCIDHVCFSAGVDSIESFGYGRGYVRLREVFQELITAADYAINQGKNIVFVAHTRTVKFELPEESGAYDRYKMKLTKHVEPIVKEWGDALLFINFQTTVVTDKQGRSHAIAGRRMCYACHSALYDAKNRWDIPSEFPLADAWDHIRPHIPGALDESTVQAPQEAPQAPQAPQEAPQAPQAPQEALKRLAETSGMGLNTLVAVVKQRGYVTDDSPIELWSAGLCEWLISVWTQIEQAAALYNAQTVPIPF